MKYIYNAQLHDKRWVSRVLQKTSNLKTIYRHSVSCLLLRKKTKIIGWSVRNHQRFSRQRLIAVRSTGNQSIVTRWRSHAHRVRLNGQKPQTKILASTLLAIKNFTNVFCCGRNDTYKPAKMKCHHKRWTEPSLPLGAQIARTEKYIAAFHRRWKVTQMSVFSTITLHRSFY